MKYKILAALLCFAFPAFSQDCNTALLAKKTGSWKAGQQGFIQNVLGPDLAKEKLVLANIHKMMNSHYDPTGCQVSYSTVYGKNIHAGEQWTADPYHYAMYILPYLCDRKSTDPSKYTVAVSSATNVDITANVIFWLDNLYAANIPADDFRGYLKLKQRPQKQDDAWFMGEEIVGDYGMPSEIRETRWLITYDDALPFYYVSRKEYLLIQKKRLEKDLKDSPGDKAFTNKFLNNVMNYLNRSEAELSEPAISMWNEEERFEKFVAEGTKGSFIAVKPNLSYFHKNLPKSSPQFFTVVYKISAGDSVFEENIANIKKAIDLTVLKNMLGK